MIHGAALPRGVAAFTRTAETADPVAAIRPTAFPDAIGRACIRVETLPCGAIALLRRIAKTAASVTAVGATLLARTRRNTAGCALPQVGADLRRQAIAAAAVAPVRAAALAHAIGRAVGDALAKVVAGGAGQALAALAAATIGSALLLPAAGYALALAKVVADLTGRAAATAPAAAVVAAALANAVGRTVGLALIVGVTVLVAKTGPTAAAAAVRTTLLPDAIGGAIGLTQTIAVTKLRKWTGPADPIAAVGTTLLSCAIGRTSRRAAAHWAKTGGIGGRLGHAIVKRLVELPATIAFDATTSAAVHRASAAIQRGHLAYTDIVPQGSAAKIVLSAYAGLYGRITTPRCGVGGATVI